MHSRELPSGTVTLLFTDVEGSTRLLEEHGSGYAELLAEHQRVLREVFRQHSGVEVNTWGDAFFVAFSRADDAVAAAEEARQALAGGPVRVRMGLHTGQPIVTGDDYVGVDVHRAARIGACAHGDQIVLSEATHRLLSDKVSVVDLGEHRLKDLTRAERLYQLGEGEFPPLGSLDVTATNLPVATSALVGRQHEVQELVALLSNGSRLVTVTGPGGTGKTRLALQVAAELVGRLRDGVYWVPLGGLTDPELVPAEIALAVGSRNGLVGFLRDRELLVLLDNFEHLLDAAPEVSAALAAAVGLRVLVTSRAPLHISGEQEYRLEPLPAKEAAALFVERARAIGREVAADTTVDAICRRLDGLPLAVELAAARTRLLSPARLLERLETALPVLTGGTRDAPERQKTLRDTIQWSYDLVDQASRELFARLSVFAGSFALSDAEEVCDADLDGVGALVDSSLLKPLEDDRFVMLETIRDFALERLACCENGSALWEKHAAFFLRLAECAYKNRFVAESRWSRLLALDHDNLRAALVWLFENDANRALELAGALGWFWLSHGFLAEGRGRLTAALARSSSSGSSRARALTACGPLTARQGDIDQGRAELDEGIGLWRGLGDRNELASALDALGWVLVEDAGDNSCSLTAFEESLELRRKLRDRLGQTRALVGVCQVLVALGDVDRAESLSRELLEMANGDPRIEHYAYHFLADCALIRGDAEYAASRYRQSLRAALALGDFFEITYELQGVAMATAGTGNVERALRLGGFAEAQFESVGASTDDPTFWGVLLERYLGGARQQLGSKADCVWAQGRKMPFDDAIELALTRRVSDLDRWVTPALGAPKTG